MTNPVLQTQILRLGDAVQSFTEADAFQYGSASTPAEKEAVRAVLQDLVSRGKLRREGVRYWRVRE